VEEGEKQSVMGLRDVKGTWNTEHGTEDVRVDG
jgi:hypothetical protein